MFSNNKRKPLHVSANDGHDRKMPSDDGYHWPKHLMASFYH
jgi:hypothetical protein